MTYIYIAVIWLAASIVTALCFSLVVRKMNVQDEQCPDQFVIQGGKSNEL